MKRTLAMLCTSAAVLQAAGVTADSERGAALFQTLSCVQCHSVNGKGGRTAPDLGRRIDRGFTPASLAATMWNHAPTMWGAMREKRVEPGDLNEQAAADLFAYFYSARFFDQPGDAGRGKQLFSSKQCADCHGIAQPKLAEAKPVSQWQSIGHPIDLADDMWNHGVNMRQEFTRRNFRWPQLTGQDMDDILVYLRNLPVTRNTQPRTLISSGANGENLFDSKGCAACHTGKLDLGPRLKDKTLTDIAAEMWNHQQNMSPNPPQLTRDEMRDLVSYLWAGEFFTDNGNRNAGEKVFRSKQCALCHNDNASGAPKLTGSGMSFTAPSMVSALWRHGPRMLAEMQPRGIKWPHFQRAEMSNLIAYLNAKNSGK